MDRQPVNNNLHHLQAKGLATNDGLPSTSRQVSKNWSRPNHNKQASKNVSVRYPNKHQRAREPKSAAQHYKDNIDSSRSYLADSRHVSHRKKPVNNGKASIKERFVQANCQFVMSSINDNSEHLKDPDLPISWELVEEVVFTCVNNELCCPVCLCAPIAAKITRCGHIYCNSCILHYLALSDKDERACPICFETVQKAELKSVSIINKIEYAMNDYLTFSLMKIRKSSTIALPANYEPEEPLHRLKRNTSQTLDQFGKMFTASPEYLSSLFEREKNELTEQLLEFQQENMPEVCFVHSAFEELEKRMLQVEQITSLCQQFAGFSLPTATHTIVYDDYVYFYQSDDGQLIYLHPLNVRMLKHEFGELKNCPTNITAKIIELQWESVHDEMRRRFAHLRHLPLSCEFKIAEVELDTSTVSQATLDEFASEITNRMKNRKRKEKAQKIRDQKIEIENKRKIYGISQAPTFQLDNATDFPAYQAENEIWVPIEPTSSPDAELGSSSRSSLSSTEFQSSFAKMLSAGGGGSGGGHNFNNTIRKNPAKSGEDDAEADAMVMQSMNITLGDFFDNCIKTTKCGRRKTKKK